MKIFGLLVEHFENLVALFHKGFQGFLKQTFMQRVLTSGIGHNADVEGHRMWHREGGDEPDLAHAEGLELGEVHFGYRQRQLAPFRSFHSPFQGLFQA